MILHPLIHFSALIAQNDATGLFAGGAAMLVILLLVLLSLAAIIWAIIDIIKNPRLSSTERIIWVLVVLFLELLGVLIYALVGRKR